MFPGTTAKPAPDMNTITGLTLATATATAEDGSKCVAIVMLNEEGQVVIAIPLSDEGARQMASNLLELCGKGGLAS